MTASIYLLFFLIVFILTVFILPSYRLWKRTGIRPWTFKNDDDPHSYIGKVFKAIFVLEFATVALYALGGDWAQYLLPFWYLEHRYIAMTGWTFLHLSIIWIMIAQYQMANSWRIGIDHQHKTELITSGLFARSRNPIFLGILLADLGIFIVIPNAVTLLIGGLSFLAIQVQVRLEEEHLSHTIGQEYDDYVKRVGRWVS